MQTIIIPGYSHKNKEWAKEVAKNIPDSEIYEWSHWKNESIKFNTKSEAENLKNLVSLSTERGENTINIIAKSIGSLVSVIALKQFKDKLNKIIFCGIPVQDISEDEKWEYKVLSDLDP